MYEIVKTEIHLQLYFTLTNCVANLCRDYRQFVMMGWMAEMLQWAAVDC